MGETWYQVEQSDGKNDWAPIRAKLSRHLAFKGLEEAKAGLAALISDPKICGEFRANLEKMNYRVAKVEICERKTDMGDRMKLKKLIELLQKYDPEADVAYQVSGAGPNGCNGSAFRLLEVWERPFDDHSIVFLNIVAE